MNEDSIKLATSHAISTYIKDSVDSGKLTDRDLIKMNSDLEKQAAEEGVTKGDPKNMGRGVPNMKSSQAPPAMQNMIQNQGGM
jgi:hypothetical protein